MRWAGAAWVQGSWATVGGVGAGHAIERAVWLISGCVLAACALSCLGGIAARIARRVRERRIVRAWAQPSLPDAASVGCPRPGVGRLVGGGNGRHRGRAQGPPSPRELSLLVAEVATRLRAGAPVSLAWRLALARIGVGGGGSGDDAYPPVLDEWASEPGRWGFLPASLRRTDAVAARSSAASIAVACRFSRVLGAPLAGVLDAIGGAIDDAQAVEEARRVASAGPLMSARVLSALPFVGIVAACALGASPWEFYTGGKAGSVCALIGVVAWIAGIASCRRILDRCRSSEDTGVDPALACDLVASGLACGAAIPRALDALADACAQECLAWTATSLRLGTTWADAWEDTPAWAHPLHDALEASWTCGSAPEIMLARCAAWERRTRLADAQTRAEELSVRLVGPLGVFFLPAFLALGIAPLLAHLMAGIEA